MQNFFTPKNITVIGVSSKKNKVGHVIYAHLREHFKTYAVNVKGKKVLGDKTYKSVLNIKGKVDLGVVAVPARFVLQTVEECGKKGIRNLVIVTSGFSEIGNDALEEDLHKLLDKYGIQCMGPNCLGVFDAHSGLDTLFLPVKKMGRPLPGGISFITQSGAVGSTTLDMIANNDIGFAKFISYGNGLTLDEADFLEYLGEDKQTKVICMYIEGIKDGKKFMKVAKRIKKPIVVIKAGRTKVGQKATMSHTGSLAGSYEIHKGAFKQSGVTLVESLRDMFNIAKVFEILQKPSKKTVQIITNGGGFGIITADAMESAGLRMANLGSETKIKLKKEFSDLVTISNPMDLVGDVTNERYAIAVNACVKDPNVGILAVIVLTQTPLIDEQVVDIIKKHRKKKPIVILTLGGQHTKKVADKFEKHGFCVFEFPEDAAKALKAYSDYY